MAISVKAVYEDGMLNPAQPLPLQEHEKVKATIEPDRNSVERTAGLIQWTGDHETLRRLAEDVEFDPRRTNDLRRHAGDRALLPRLTA